MTKAIGTFFSIGGRNLAKTAKALKRQSSHINHRVTQSAFRAFDYAKATDRLLNTYVVVNLPETAECGAAMAFAAIRHKYRDWLAYKAKLRQQRMPPVYIYTFENPAGRMHVNWVVHVPDALQDEFREKLQQWVTKVRGVVGPYDVHVQPVEVAYHKRLAKYVLKGTDRNYTRHFHLEDVDEGPQGEVWGRRAGISQAIGRRARARDSYHPGRNRPYIPAFMTPPTGGGVVGSWRSAPP